MPGKHNAGGCGCCGDCTDNDSARVSLLASLGLSDLNVTGGPVQASTTTDYRMMTCSPFFPDGNTYGAFSTFDFSSPSSATISSTPTSILQTACPPVNSGGSLGLTSMGAIDFTCIGSDVDARGFGTRSFFPSASGTCPNGYGANYLDYFASFTGSVIFTCTSGVSSYILSVGTTLILFTLNATGVYSVPAASGSDWTRTAPDGTTSPRGLYTKTGSTSSAGSTVEWQLLSSGTPTGFSLWRVNASTWVSNPTTSVTMWNPTDVIDFTGLTAVGTASLS